MRAFRFDAAICDVCPLRPSCMRARPGKDRVVMIHPQEAASRILEAAREKRSVAYIPSKWRPIMFLIRNLPARLVPK